MGVGLHMHSHARLGASFLGDPGDGCGDRNQPGEIDMKVLFLFVYIYRAIFFWVQLLLFLSVDIGRLTG